MAMVAPFVSIFPKVARDEVVGAIKPNSEFG